MNVQGSVAINDFSCGQVSSPSLIGYIPRASLTSSGCRHTYTECSVSHELTEGHRCNSFSRHLAATVDRRGHHEQLQQDRIEKAKQAEQAILDERQAIVKRAAKISANCYKLKKSFCPTDFGFDFSYTEYAHYWKVQDAQYELTEEVLDFHKVIEAYRNPKKVA